MLVEYPKNKGTDELISGFIKVATEREVDPRAICVAGGNPKSYPTERG